MDEKIKSYFRKDITIESLTRTDLMNALIKRHSETLAPMKSELGKFNKKRDELEKLREEARKERDVVNDEVRDIKQIRQMLHELTNDKRREFFVLMEKLDDMQKLDDEIEDYSSSLDRMEWEIQTTKITASDEKVTIKRMKEIYQKLTEANREAQVKLGIQEQVASLSSEIGEKLAEAQSRHEELLKKADKSDVFHDQFVDRGKELSELRMNIRRTERRIQIHKECLKYWKDWVGGKHA